MSDLASLPVELATSRPGRTISWRSIGSGPGLVVLHGAARTGRHLGALAEAMKGYFTVHLVDRNGRGQSMPAKPEDGIDGQMDDIETVFSTTSARYLFGHSAGGMIALAAARKLHPDKLALYDPGISVDGSFPAVLVQRFETALANGNLAEAQARLARAVDAVPKWLPLPLLRVLLAGVIASPAGAETRKLLPTTSADFNLIVADDGPAQRFAEIIEPVLVMRGGKSPAFLSEAAGKLVSALPDAKEVVLSRQGHNAPDLSAPEQVAGPLISFLQGHR